MASLSTPHRQRAKRLTGAARTALNRVKPAPLGLEGPGAMFAALGETVIWLVALDDLLLVDMGPRYRDADPVGPLVAGLRFSRDAVVHGNTVSELHEVGGGAWGAMRWGAPTARYGLGRRFVWMQSTRITFNQRNRHERAQRAAYDAHLAEHEVYPTLRTVLRFLRHTAGT